MEVTMGSRTTVKQLITALLEMPMASKIEIGVRDKNGNMQYADVYEICTDEYNGNNRVVLTSK